MIERAKTIIETIEYLTIASICPDQTPWNTPVYTTYDEDLNFYWASWMNDGSTKNNNYIDIRVERDFVKLKNNLRNSESPC